MIIRRGVRSSQTSSLRQHHLRILAHARPPTLTLAALPMIAPPTTLLLHHHLLPPHRPSIQFHSPNERRPYSKHHVRHVALSFLTSALSYAAKFIGGIIQWASIILTYSINAEEHLSWTVALALVPLAVVVGIVVFFWVKIREAGRWAKERVWRIVGWDTGEKRSSRAGEYWVKVKEPFRGMKEGVKGRWQVWQERRRKRRSEREEKRRTAEDERRKRAEMKEEETHMDDERSK